MKILVTGSSGFIGFHLSMLLLKKGNKVLGIDCMNNYYDVNLKKARLNILRKYKNFSFNKINLENEKKIKIFLKSLNQICNSFSCSSWCQIQYR
jgi:UDP-glucuronate 4-epimerase